MGLKTILIVDDDDNFRTMLKEYLKKKTLGLEIFEASTGEMGVAKAACVKPDVVLMDINLPNASGFEATKHIKGDRPECDVIILTMFEVKSFKEASKEILATDFIGKSEIDERLVPAIKKCLASKTNQPSKRRNMQ